MVIFLFALVCTVDTMSSFSLPSSNQDQMTSLPQNSTSYTPTPESSLDSGGFYFEPFDFSILNKSNHFHKQIIFISALVLVSIYIKCFIICLLDNH